jgi:hypothetical protein
MVVIRIKANDDTNIPKKISGDNIKIVTNLKLCKLTGNEIDEKTEKKIEFLISAKPGKNIKYNEKTDEYTIFGLQQSHMQSSSDMDLSYQRYKFTKSSYQRSMCQKSSGR